MKICRVCQSYTYNFNELSTHLVPLTEEQRKLGIGVDIVTKKVKKIVERIRDMSPLYEDFLEKEKNI